MASVILAIGFATFAGIKHQKEKRERKRLEQGTITYYPDSDNEHEIVQAEKSKRRSLREKASRKLHRGGNSEKASSSAAAPRNSEDTLVPDGQSETTMRV